MDMFAFVFTIFFMLLGPVKIIVPFARVMQGADERFTRAVAIRSILIASAVAAFLVLVGPALLGRYRISIDGIRIAGGLVLLVAALKIIFPGAQPRAAGPGNAKALQLAVSPMATPVIVSPAGVAAILLFMMLSPEHPGIIQAVALALAIVMALDFLVMFFNRAVMKTPGIMPMLELLGAVLVFIQVALAVETILISLKHMGIIL